MTNIDLTTTLLDLYKAKPGVIGKFNVSSVWGILHGYTSIDQFLNGENRDFSQIFKMWQGTWKHNQVQELLKELGYKLEKRIEYKTPNFILVGKADAILEDTILEIKTSTELLSVAKSWHIEQLKIYLSLFKKEKGIIVQPITQNNKLILKEIGVVERDDKFFKKVLEGLDKFYQKLNEIKAKIKEEKEKV